MAVVLFHAAPNFVPGGFVGVDVFFVISGFLITRNIIADVDNNEFSFRRFYVRRIRRLFPALFVTIAVSLAAAILLLTPRHLEQFAGSALYSLASLANIFFWQQTGYFDDEALFKPLLHFWSLGVEEQFYLIWPITLAVILRLRPKLLPVTLLLLGTGSLIAAQTSVMAAPTAAFYFTPFRMWEFAIGAACLWAPKMDHPRGWIKELAFATGVLLIVSSSLLYTKDTPFPGVNALAPCIGAALSITAGRARLGWLVRNRLAVWIGLISYSLYLVHWPLIVFYKYWKFAPISVFEQVCLISVSILLASLMYNWVEQPFRRPGARHGLTPAVATSLVIGLFSVTIIPSYFAWWHDGWPWRLHGRAALYWKQIGDATNGVACSKPAYPQGGVWLCQFGEDKGQEFDAVLIGDSHAWHWLPGFDALFRRNHLAGVSFTAGGSLPFVGGMRYDGNVPLPSIAEWTRGINDFILQHRPAVVIISARWSMHVLTTREPGEEGARKFFTYKQYQELTALSSRAAVRAALIDTVERYKNAGIYTILLGQVPYPGPTIAECLTRPNWIFSPKTDLACQQTSKEDALMGPRATNGMLLEAANMFPQDTSLFLLSELMCRGKTNCDFLDENGSYYWINGHLSQYGSVELAKKYLQPVVSLLKRELAARAIGSILCEQLVNGGETDDLGSAECPHGRRTTLQPLSASETVKQPNEPGRLPSR